MAVCLLLVVVLLILAAEFVNGRNDACTAIATVVSTRVLTPMQAVTMAVVLNMAGVLLMGTAVASTVGAGLINPESHAITLPSVGAAVLTVFIWCTLANRYGVPVSTSHALFGGLAGAGVAVGGFAVFTGTSWGWLRVLMGLFFSTLLGFIAGYVLILGVLWVFHKAHRRHARDTFGRMQILSSAFLAFSHGSNDGQKFMGVLTLALILGGVLSSDHIGTRGLDIPFWVKAVCSVVMGLGTSIGGWKLIRTMGVKLVRLEPQEGFAAQTAAATMIVVASRLGVPLSSTHTISTSIMGVGASRRLSAVRWGIAGQVVTAWLVTFPACALIAWLVCWLLGYVLPR
jgi:inorganic phosphate transporter, PiT family